MVAGAYVTKGTATVSASAPGVVASVTVTATGAAAGDTVIIQQTSTARDAYGAFTFKVTDVTTNAFTITADRPQLPEDVTFSWIVFDAA